MYYSSFELKLSFELGKAKNGQDIDKPTITENEITLVFFWA